MAAIISIQWLFFTKPAMMALSPSKEEQKALELPEIKGQSNSVRKDNALDVL